VPPKNLLELERLSYVVQAIENDCACVPIGAFKLIKTHEIRLNEMFSGLNLDEARKLNSY